MVELINAELRAAQARGRAVFANEPRAVAARYDPDAGRVIVELASGCSYAFPAALVQDLQGAGPDDLACVEVDGLGFNLHFSALNVDLYVPALVAGIFGTNAWMARELARIAGRTTSAAKAVASRANGAKGGRPRKAARG